MSNTMKSIIFIISLFVFLGIYTLASNMMILLAGSVPDSTLSILFIAALSAAYIFMLYTQAFIKQLYTKRQLRGANILLKLNMPPFKFNERLVAYVLPLLSVFIPLFKGKALSTAGILSVLCLIILIIIVEILYYLNSKTMHTYITNKGIAIMGVDLRFELALPLNYTNISGFYPFERIDEFLAFPDRVILYNLFDSSVMTILCNNEESRQTKALLLANNIPEKKLQ